MTGRGIFFLVLALVFGLVAFFMAQRFVGQPGPTQMAEMETVPVVLARLDVGTAERLSVTELEVVDWPKAYAPPGALASTDAAVGRVTRRPIASGEPILEAALYEQGVQGGLGAVIETDKRAVSVKVDNVIGVAGFVTPGSRVDVLATMRRVDWDKPLPGSRVILQDVKVLAVDQQLEEPRGEGEAETINVVTLEVDPDQAQKLIYAAHEGRLQLALRTPGDDLDVPSTAIYVADLMDDKGPQASPSSASQAPSAPRAARRGASVQVLRGSQVDNQSF